MADTFNLERFVDAQRNAYETAFAELRAGHKQSHWMWFVFPQLAGLGTSGLAQFYGIGSLEEARAYLNHALLGLRLRSCVATILPFAPHRSAEEIFGAVDALKLRSSLTLFDQVDPHGVFGQGLEAFYSARRDERTLALLNAAR